MKQRFKRIHDIFYFIMHFNSLENTMSQFIGKYKNMGYFAIYLLLRIFFNFHGNCIVHSYWLFSYKSVI